jgi:hypothetical protein
MYRAASHTRNRATPRTVYSCREALFLAVQVERFIAPSPSEPIVGASTPQTQYQLALLAKLPAPGSIKRGRPYRPSPLASTQQR